MSDMDEGEEVPQPTAIVARNTSGEPVRLFQNRQQLIQANLAGVKYTAKKKQIAQQHFYDDNGNSLKFEDDDNRGPVHRRLGKRVILRRNYGSQTQYGRRLNQYGRRAPYNYTQQGRLTRPREGMKLYTARYLQSIPPKVLTRQNNRWLERSNATQILRAVGREDPQMALNYTIEVPNNNCGSTMPTTYFPSTFRHSIRAQLNPNLQSQIRAIQAECVSVSLAPIDMIPTICSGATKINMNDRFNLLG